MLDRKTLTMLLSLLLLSLSTAAQTDDPEARALAERIAQRAANEGRVGTMHFTLTNKSGKQRQRVALMAHSDDVDSTRLLISFTAPSALRGTAFVSHQSAQESDETWLFLPATERVRRIPSSQRSDYFLGTDLTYGDIEDNFKFGLDDWYFNSLSSVDYDGRSLPLLSGQVRGTEIAAELGYSAFTAIIDPDTLFPLQIEYQDTDGVALKRVEVMQQQQIGGAWTAMTFCVINHQSQHRTDVRFDDMRYMPDLDTSVFDAQALVFGTPQLR